MRVALAAAALAAAVAGSGAFPHPPPAAGTTTHHAALIVDTGVTVKQVCVGFSEDSVSGRELLDRAGVDPVYRPYGDKGVAVCALCGKGCPADQTCLTCGGRDYWAYHRAPAGTDHFTPSGVGASSTRVHDGDVEGWRWGTGGPPAYAPFTQVCGTGGSPSSPTTAAPSTPSTTAAGSAPPTPGPAITTTAPPSPSSTATAVTRSTAGPAAAATARDHDEDGGAGRSLLAFAAVMGGLVAWIARARRARRRRMASPGP